MVVLVLVVVVLLFVIAGLDIPVRKNSYVLRVCVGGWGCALVCGVGVVRVVVVCGMWCGVVVVGVMGVVAIFGFGCVGVGGDLGIWCVLAMVVCCGLGCCALLVVVVSSCR
jgi:hypothetical protein